MISCTEFIPAYSELFKFLEKKKNKEAVVDFWNFLSDEFLTNMEEEVIENGLLGCWNYWNKTLKEEAADFTMEIDEEKQEFTIKMHHCPSKGLLLEQKHIEPYRDYCEHCPALYQRVLDPLGFEYKHDRSQTDKARCSITVKPKRKTNK